MAGAAAEARFAGLSLVQLHELLEDEGQLAAMVQTMEEVGARGARRAGGNGASRPRWGGRGGTDGVTRGLGPGRWPATGLGAASGLRGFAAPSAAAEAASPGGALGVREVGLGGAGPPAAPGGPQGPGLPV